MKLLPLTSIRMWHSGTTWDTAGRRRTGFWRLGSESKVARRALLEQEKRPQVALAYPNGVPQAPAGQGGSIPPSPRVSLHSPYSSSRVVFAFSRRARRLEA